MMLKQRGHSWVVLRVARWADSPEEEGAKSLPHEFPDTLEVRAFTQAGHLGEGTKTGGWCTVLPWKGGRVVDGSSLEN